MKILLIPALWGDFNHGLERTMSKVVDVLNERGRAVDVAVSRDLDLDAIRRTFSVELKQLNLRRVPQWGAQLRKAPLIGRQLAGLQLRRGFAQLTSEYDLAIVQSTTIPPASRARRSVLFTEFPRDPKPVSRDWRERLASYDLLIGNSAYTCSWIERYWQHPTEIFFPSIQECAPLTKEPIILGVGRFAKGGREKGQIEMVDTFRAMIDDGLANWRLALAGHSGNPEYIARVRQRAEGYPIDLHIGSSGAELRALYGKSSLFWHTTGLGADPELEPARFEHFGIVVAEAMTAGCVPLVFGAAGPQEIVQDPALCWHSLEELRAKSDALIKNSARRSELAERCRASAVDRFGHAAFKASVDRIVDAESA